MSKSVILEVKKSVSRRELVLFVGSGVSANLGLPPWSGLIEKMATDIGFEPSLFMGASDFPALAEYYEIKKGGRTELVKWMHSEWHGPSISTLNSIIHDAIVKCNFPKIYTTNYDHWLERSYTERGVSYQKVVDVRDIPKMVEGETTILKFHGDIDVPDSMVLTESDYANRMSLESELDIQFRSDSLQRGVLFVGYSLSDKNLRYILHKLKQIRMKYGNGIGAPKSYLFTHRVNHVERELFKQWSVEVILSDELAPAEALENFMKAIT